MVQSSKDVNAQSSGQPVWYPGQAEYIPSFVKPLQELWSNPSAPTPLNEAIRQMTSEAAGKETTAERGRLARTPGLSDVGRLSAVTKAGEGAIGAEAGAPLSAWESVVLPTLSQYALQAPSIANISKQTGGGGFGVGCCFIFLAGELLTEDVRRYRDEHYPKQTHSVSKGYRKMARWLVPLMKRYPLVLWAVRFMMLNPLASYASWYYNHSRWGWIAFPVKMWWTGVWRICGQQVTLDREELDAVRQ